MVEMSVLIRNARTFSSAPARNSVAMLAQLMSPDTHRCLLSLGEANRFVPLFRELSSEVGPVAPRRARSRRNGRHTYTHVIRNRAGEI